MLVPEPIRLPMLNAVRIPEGVEDITVRKGLLNQYGIEIGGAATYIEVATKSHINLFI